MKLEHWDIEAETKTSYLQAENERLRNMITEQIQMVNQPAELRLNTAKRAQMLLDSLGPTAHEGNQ